MSKARYRLQGGEVHWVGIVKYVVVGALIGTVTGLLIVAGPILIVYRLLN